MTSRNRDVARSTGAVVSGSTGIAAGLLSVVAASCCISPVLAPIIVGVLGASGAVWAASLQPYAYWILGGAAIALAVGFWTAYRPQTLCEPGTKTRARSLWPNVAKGTLWLGAVFWVAALLVQFIIPN